MSLQNSKSDGYWGSKGGSLSTTTISARPLRERRTKVSKRNNKSSRDIFEQSFSDKVNETNRPICHYEQDIGAHTSVSSIQKYKILGKIRKYTHYPKGWDGTEDSIPATIKAKNHAENFLASLPLYKIHSPKVSLAADGEINFYWKLPNKTILDLGFLEEDSFSLYFRGADREEYIGNKICCKKSLPDHIIKALEFDE